MMELSQEQNALTSLMLAEICHFEATGEAMPEMLNIQIKITGKAAILWRIIMRIVKPEKRQMIVEEMIQSGLMDVAAGLVKALSNRVKK